MRGWPGVIALGCVAGLAACQHLQPQAGLSGKDAELARRQGEFGFAVISDEPSRTVIAAKGQNVVIAPASGFCVAPESVDVSGKAAFALVSDCDGGPADARAFPGIVTVSVSSAPMLPQGVAKVDALDELRRFITTPEGMSLLGRAPRGGVIVLETREIGDGLYVLVQDRQTTPLPVLAPRFWRAFVELSGRMTMVTVSSFRESPVSEDTMLSFLTAQVVALRRANSQPASKEELDLVAAVEGEFIASADAAAGAPVFAELDGEGSGDGDAIGDEPEAVGQAVASLEDEGTLTVRGSGGPFEPMPANDAQADFLSRINGGR